MAAAIVFPSVNYALQTYASANISEYPGIGKIEGKAGSREKLII
jgi:hypothetical protein